jgi:signal transduction histidine kinase/ActR/RegA family two-component response regulator
MGRKKRPVKILISSNVPDDLEPITDWLLAENYCVSHVDLLKAIARVREFKSDLIILNIPGAKNVDDLAKKLLEKSHSAKIPVLLVVDRSNLNDQISAIEQGFDDCLLKPFARPEFLSRIRLHIALRRKDEDLKMVKEAGEAAARAKTLLLANMSHEIRTPMNGIVGMVDILKETQLTKRQREYLDIIDLSGENLLMIINDILDFSKIEAGQISFEPIRFNLRNEVNEVVKLLKYKAEQKMLRFGVEFDSKVSEWVIGDPLRLKQVLINLCNNAIKFTQSGSVRVLVKLSKKTHGVEVVKFEVIDTGIGISPENQRKLFKTFSQVDASISRKYGGTGLGLAICKRLVKLMNGRIGVESAEGLGSRFYFTTRFEIALSDSKLEKDLVSARELMPQKVLKILLAEDNVINQKVAAIGLKKLGHEVVLAINGLNAFEKFKHNTFDVVLMDIHMPEMDGVEATRLIREYEKTKNSNHRVPIIAMTANNLKSDKEKFILAGMNDYLGKPFNLTDLVRVLNRVLSE